MDAEIVTNENGCRVKHFHSKAEEYTRYGEKEMKWRRI